MADIGKINRLLNNKTKKVNLSFNEELLEIMDKTVLEEKFSSRQELIDTAILTYLESKGKI